MLKKPLESFTSFAGQVQKQMAYSADVAKASVVNATLGAKDATVEAVVRQAGKVVDLAQSVFKIPYIEFPLSIAFTVAPVPVAVGCGLMMLMDWKLHGAQERVEDAHAEAKKVVDSTERSPCFKSMAVYRRQRYWKRNTSGLRLAAHPFW